ncbi:MULTISPECIES: MerR family transcriptional regulator [Halomonas]|uniref:MerR family transcriptional regulator n=1 Tax=Halomonas TaxID=2745 RepID=UPI001C96C2EB|nr:MULTISPECIES: MerR family DNA-binding protein [Halomonas]MBY6209889.1 MerR family DNA-binding protein [Halomonas sp. DP3Y7-2]MBY6230108.1 MerR family DNA-binding protein [Halomonas sp. DP3Y7-1]MCA0918077.1 MerR family DNA-binding protein [Halomonas denitrificans]
MKVSELATSVGVTSETVRHYTREGLLSPSKDPANGYHRYSEQDRERLSFIQRARTLGFSLADIRQILVHADQGDSPCPLVRDLLAERLPKIRQRIAELEALAQRMEDAMTSWQDMPDGMPNGHSLCRLIESVPADAPATGGSSCPSLAHRQEAP